MIDTSSASTLFDISLPAGVSVVPLFAGNTFLSLGTLLSPATGESITFRYKVSSMSYATNVTCGTTISGADLVAMGTSLDVTIYTGSLPAGRCTFSVIDLPSTYGTTCTWDPYRPNPAREMRRLPRSPAMAGGGAVHGIHGPAVHRGLGLSAAEFHQGLQQYGLYVGLVHSLLVHE